MLRSFQYTENPCLERTIQSRVFWEKEVDIARRYVASHPIRKDLHNFCPICGQAAGEYFYTKWEVDYLRCAHCRTVFAVHDRETALGYARLEELRALHADACYQAEATRNRAGLWEEFVGWMEVRAYRFLRRSKRLSIVDVGNRYRGYVDCLQASALCGRYDLRQSLLEEDGHAIGDGEADLVLFFDQMKKETAPRERLAQMRRMLGQDGLLVVSTRAGSGFDILVLKECNDQIYPYEHILLPSVKGLVHLMEEEGYEVLEVTTPGVMDVQYVAESMGRLDRREEFVRSLLEEAGPGIAQEFQRFLQKSGTSSFVCVIARKKGKR